MLGKNRTIPLTTKEQAQVQTQVNLLNRDEQFSQRNRISEERDVRFSEIITQNVLLKSFSNSQVFQELNRLIGDLKKQGSGSEHVDKRISLVQKQLQGLMKRSLLINQKGQNHEAGSDYYSIISQKEKQKLKLQYKLSYSDIKLQRYEIKIHQLQRQIASLRQTISFTKNCISENQIYKNFVVSMKQDKRVEARKFVELQTQLEKINSIASKQSKISENIYDGEANDLFGYLANVVQRLTKQGRLNKQNLNQAIYSLYQLNTNFNSEISNTFQYKSKYENLSSKYQQLSSIFKQQVEQLSRSNPQIKGLKNIEELISWTSEKEREVQFINIAGWVGIGKISKSLSYVSASAQTRTEQKKLLSLFAKQMKLLLDRYPKLSTQLSQQVRFIFSKHQFLQQLIQSQSFSRLKQIVTYEPQIVRVDNLYQYSNKKDQSIIFNLRVLIKSLLEEVQRIRKTHEIDVTIDAGILQMMRAQVIDGVNIEQIIAIYRPLPKIVEVEKIVEKPVYINGTLQKGVPIRTQRAVIAQAFSEKAVQVIKQVPVYIQRVVNNTVKQYVQVSFQNQKIVEIPTIRQVIAQKVMVNEKLNDVQVEKIVSLYEQKIVEVESNRQVVVQISKIVQVEKIVQVPAQKEYIQIQKLVEKPVYIKQTKDRIRQIQVINQKVFQRDRYIQIERRVPHIITNRQTVYLDRQVPRFITNTQQRQVNVTQIIEKLVPYKVIEEKVVEVPVIQEKQVIRQIQKEVIVEVTHFIKGDREEIIKQVQVIVQKPYREQVLITKQLQIQKIVPLYFKEQKPVYIQMQTPYIQTQAKIIKQEISKIVPVRQQVIKQVRVQVPVPVIVQKQIIKVETVFIDRIIEKIVEVPRIVQIQKIVQKIVVVPRIIEKIVQVIRIVEKIVTVQVPCLQIVQVFRQIPVIREVQVIKQVIVEKTVLQVVKQIQIVERQKMVQVVIEKQVPKEVQVQRRIPVQVIREVPVEVFRDRIVEKIVEIHEVTVKDREVMVPFRYQVPVQFIVQKPVVTEKVIQNIVKVPQVIEREKAVTNTVTIPEIVEVRIEKAIEVEVIRQIPGPETIKYILVPKQIQLLREKVVQVQSIIEVPKQVYLYMDKIVHEYHEKLYPIHVPIIVEQPYLVEVSKPQHYIHYKQIPVEIQTNRNVPIRTIIDQIQQVTKQVHHQQQIEVFRERIKEIIKESKQFIHKEVQKEILREVVINQTRVQTFEIPSQPRLVETRSNTVQVRANDNYIQKVVERIVMLPQIVEVVKHLHEITEVQSLGVASNTSVQQYTQQFTLVSSQLRTSLIELLQRFRQSAARQPDLKGLILVIQKHLSNIQKWINFPKIVEVEKEVEKVVQKERVVLVPTNDHQRESSLSYLVEKLVTELRRIKERNRIELQLDEDIQRLFFKDNRSGLSEAKFEELQKSLRAKYASLGEWTQSYPFMINSFLQDYFTLNSTVEQVSSANSNLKEQIEVMQGHLRKDQEQIICLNSHNAQVLRNHSRLLQVLRSTQESQKQLTTNEIKAIVSQFQSYKTQIRKVERTSQIEERRSRVVSSVSHYRVQEGMQTSTQQIMQTTNQQISTMISKTSKLEIQNQNLNGRLRSYESQIKVLESQMDRLRLNQQSRSSESRSSQQQPSSPSNLKVIEQIKTRLINQNEQKIKRIQESQTQQLQRLRSTQEKEIQRLKAAQQKQLQRIQQQRSSTSNNQTANENRKLAEQLRIIKRDLQVEKRSIDSLKQQHEREVQNIKKQHQLNLQKKDSNISSIQSVKARISEDYQKKIKQLKQVHERQLERIKSTSVRRDETERKEDKQKEDSNLKDKIKRLQIQLQTSKKQVQLFQHQKSKMISTAYTASMFTSAAKQAGQVVEREKQRGREKERERYSPQQTKYPLRAQTYQSALEKKYVSPDSAKSREDDASSHKSSSSKKSQKCSKYKPQMTLRQFMQLQQNQSKDLCSTFIMIKIIQKIEQQAKHGLLHSFSPSNIYLGSLNAQKLQALTIKFGAPIVNKNNKNDGLYLAPQLLAGQKTTQKSVVFSLAVIWDELIHGQVYFKAMKDIENPLNQFKVRDAKLNPILKNTLFQMMNKDPLKRLQLHQTKRRLSLQKYIASQSKK